MSSQSSQKQNYPSGVKTLPVTRTRGSVASNGNAPYKPNSILGGEYYHTAQKQQNSVIENS